MVNLWGPICLYDTTWETGLKSRKEVMPSNWDVDIKDGQLIYKQKPDTSVYLIRNKQKDNQKIIKVFQIKENKREDRVNYIMNNYNYTKT